MLSQKMNSVKKVATTIAICSISICAPVGALAIDPALLQKYSTVPIPGGDKVPVSATGGLNVNMDTIKKMKEAQDALDARDEPFIDLPNEVSYRQFREGKGSKVVMPGSDVTVQMTMRAKKLATQKDPGGVLFYSTTKDTPYNALRWTVGDSSAVPGVEAAMMGMKRGSVRRIEIPSTQVYQARKQQQLPTAKDADELRLTKNLFKTEATMIVEVMVDKIVNPEVL